jgi:hypothetical protein
MKPMTIEDLRKADDEMLGLVVKMVEEAHAAKNALREKGYGWLGLSLLATIMSEVPNASEKTRLDALEKRVAALEGNEEGVIWHGTWPQWPPNKEKP